MFAIYTPEVNLTNKLNQEKIISLLKQGTTLTNSQSVQLRNSVNKGSLPYLRRTSVILAKYATSALIGNFIYHGSVRNGTTANCIQCFLPPLSFRSGSGSKKKYEPISARKLVTNDTKATWWIRIDQIPQSSISCPSPQIMSRRFTVQKLRNAWLQTA